MLALLLQSSIVLEAQNYLSCFLSQDFNKIPKQEPVTKKLKDKHPGLQTAWKPARGCSQRLALLEPTLLHTVQERLAWVLLSADPGTPNGSGLQNKGATIQGEAIFCLKGI